MTLEILTSDALAPAKHGFFTRRGGASSGIFKSLNCGQGSTDQTEVVTINRARVAEAMNVDATNLISIHQVHSANVVVVDQAPIKGTKADGMVTKREDVALGILTADCQPVLFHDPKARIIGAAHAGWKGALNGVLEAVIDTMVEQGAHHEDITAVIGPTISQDAYEVGPEFHQRFLELDAESAGFFESGQGDRFQFDLPGFSLNRLAKTGVNHAEWLGFCTYSDPERFFSYRRSTHEKQADYGRLIAAIRL